MKDNHEDLTTDAYVRLPWELIEGEGLDIEEAKDLRLVVTLFDDCGDRFRLEKGDTPAAVLSDARMLLRARRSEWEKDRNPVVALEAILIAYKGGLFPPIWALKWFCERLEEWYPGNDKTRLDEVLGLRSKGKGTWPAFKRAIQANHYARIREDVGLLRCLGLSLEGAAEKVARAMEEEEKEKGSLDATGWGVAKALDTATIINLCKGNNPLANATPEDIERWKAQKDVILRRFPCITTSAPHKPRKPKG
jgi:hypothetical protein